MRTLSDWDWRLRTARRIAPNWKLQARFIAASCVHARALDAFRAAPSGSALHEHLQERPETVGVLLWPYQCSAWDVRQRVAKVHAHFRVVEQLGAPVRFNVDQKLQLLDLDEMSNGVSIILDQPKWLFREGHLALSLFVGTHRAFSLAFSFSLHDNEMGVFIGGIQGRSTEGALDRYKELTKDFHGMRPRDLLLDVGRMFFARVGATRLHAVAEQHRFFRHPYFGEQPAHDMHLDYDNIWTERGGVRVAATHFDLPMGVSVRSLEDIPSKKRSMYRRRNEMLEAMSASVGESLLQPHFQDFDAT